MMRTHAAEAALINAHQVMEDDWKQKARRLSQLVRGGRSDELEVAEMFEALSAFTYPVHGLKGEVLLSV